jgi:hypothetical protein
MELTLESLTHSGKGALSWVHRQTVIRLTRKNLAAATSLPNATLNTRACLPSGNRRWKRDDVTVSERDGIVFVKGGCAIRPDEFLALYHNGAREFHSASWVTRPCCLYFMIHELVIENQHYLMSQ